MNKRKSLFVIIVFLLTINTTFAQAEEKQQSTKSRFDNPFSIGDKLFSINLGAFFPLFYGSPDFQFAKANLTVGGCGSLNLEAYITPKIRLGGNLSGCFSIGVNKKALFMVPLCIRASYEFRFWRFSLPVYLDGGVNFVQYGDLFHIDPIIKPGASLIFEVNSEWGFGLNLLYWWSPQLYFDNGLQDISRFGNFLEVSASAQYRF